MNFFEVFGLCGVICYMGSYTLLQTGYMKGDSLAYILTSMLAAILVLISLAESFNLASALIQIFGIVISLAGVLRLFTGKWSDYQTAKRRVTLRKRRMQY